MNESIRQQFPALAREVGGRPAAYLDGPGGTQTPRAVIDAMSGVLAAGVSNLGGNPHRAWNWPPHRPAPGP